jgi:hypothetical protein
MGIEQSNESVERMRHLSEKLSEQLLCHVVPIFRDDGAGKQESHGTGLLVAGAGGSFLISAAHVFDPLRSGSDLFFYVGEKRVHTLSGCIRMTRPPDGANRRADRLDIGVLRLEKAASPPYPDIGKKALPIDALRALALPRQKKHYLVTGFPASKTRLHPVRRAVESAPYGNWSMSASEAEYQQVGCSEQTHIVMPFDQKRVVGQHLTVRAFPSPAGMSGSPVWLLYDEVGENDPSHTPLVGVFIEYHDAVHLMVATDVNVALDMITLWPTV